MNDWLEQAFPRLAGTSYDITSARSQQYNCIAWAAGEDGRWWWPATAPDAYWPDGVPNDVTVDAFIQAYARLGYTRRSDASHEIGLEKIALFATPDGEPTHAARQLENGTWTSKLGPSIDISHSLRGLEGTRYGRVVAVLSRPRR